MNNENTNLFVTVKMTGGIINGSHDLLIQPVSPATVGRSLNNAKQTTKQALIYLFQKVESNFIKIKSNKYDC